MGWGDAKYEKIFSFTQNKRNAIKPKCDIAFHLSHRRCIHPEVDVPWWQGQTHTAHASAGRGFVLLDDISHHVVHPAVLRTRTHKGK